MIFNIDLGRKDGRKKNLKYKDGTPVGGLARPLEYHPNTTDWKGRWRPVKDRSNDYGIDREWQRNGDSYTGIVGVPLLVRFCLAGKPNVEPAPERVAGIAGVKGRGADEIAA